MQLGFVSAIVPELSLQEVFQLAQQEGYDCVELMCWPISKAERRYAGVTHLDVVDFNHEKALQVLQLAAKYKVKISGLGYYPNPLASDEAEAAFSCLHIKKVIEAASLLGINQMNTFVGRDHTKTVEENWPRFLSTWKPLIDFATTKSVKIGIENCPMSFGRDEWPGGKNLAISPKIWRRMFADIPNPNFGLNFDPSHFAWQMMDYLPPLQEFASRIFHIHAKDVRIDKQKLDEVGILAYPMEFHCPKLPGLGEVHWGKFFSVLGDSGYQGSVCVEVEDRAYEGSLDLRKNALTQSHTFLRNFIPKRGASA